MKLLNFVIFCIILWPNFSLTRGDEMTPKLRAKILYGHNMRRSQLALGTVTQHDCSRLPTASAMPKLVYDCQLEQSAKKWSSNCKFLHSMGKHGENLYMIRPPPPLHMVIHRAMEAWWDAELGQLTMNLPSKLNLNFFNSSNAGHFTQMSTDVIQRVGCEGTICDKLGYFFVCHYDKRQLLDRKIYETGEKCSKCITKCQKSTALCVPLKKHSHFSKSSMHEMNLSTQTNRSVRGTAAQVNVEEKINEKTFEKNNCKVDSRPTVIGAKLSLQRSTLAPFKSDLAIKHKLCKPNPNKEGKMPTQLKTTPKIAENFEKNVPTIATPTNLKSSIENKAAMQKNKLGNTVIYKAGQNENNKEKETYHTKQDVDDERKGTKNNKTSELSEKGKQKQKEMEKKIEIEKDSKNNNAKITTKLTDNKKSRYTIYELFEVMMKRILKALCLTYYGDGTQSSPIPRNTDESSYDNGGV